MKISVIIPSYDRAHLLQRAIGSVLAQTFQPHELIIVDDNSTDGTQAVLDQYEGQVKLITNSENRGVSYSRNVGIQAAEGDWIAFLDSDDEWDPRKLEAQVAYHRSHPHISISQCDEIWIRKGVRVNPMDKHAKKGGWIFGACLPRCIVSPSAVIIHREVFDQIGLFDESLPACEDYDLWLRIAPLYEIGLLDEKLVTRHGGHADQLSQKYWGMDRFRIQAMEKQVKADLSATDRQALLNELSFKCKVFSMGAAKRGNSEAAEVYRNKQILYSELAGSL